MVSEVAFTSLSASLIEMNHTAWRGTFVNYSVALAPKRLGFGEKRSSTSALDEYKSQVQQRQNQEL